MRIAFLVSQFPTISEMGVLNHLTGLLDAGHDVRIFARWGSKDPVTHPDIARYGLLERVSYFGIPKNRATRVLKGLPMALRGLPSRPRVVLESLNPEKFGIFALTLNLLYAGLTPPDNDFDIIHCQFGSNGIIGEFLREMGTSGRLVTSFRGSDAILFPRKAGKNVYRRLFANGDAFTALTEFLKNRLVELGCDPEKITVVPSSIRIERFDFKERYPRPGCPTRILTVGRLVEIKGHQFALKALAQVAHNGIDFRYLIVGDGPLREELEKLASDVGIGTHVEFLGPVTQERVKQLYDDSDIFLLPSIFEGQGLVVQEAQACGLPIVSTLHSGVPEGVVEGESALLVPERDEIALAEKLTYLLEHPERWAQMGRAGRRFVSGKYDVPAVTRRLEDIYESILERSLGSTARETLG